MPFPLAMLTPGETQTVLPGRISAVAPAGARRVTVTLYRQELVQTFSVLWIRSHVQPDGERKMSASHWCFLFSSFVTVGSNHATNKIALAATVCSSDSWQTIGSFAALEVHSGRYTCRNFDIIKYKRAQSNKMCPSWLSRSIQILSWSRIEIEISPSPILEE